MEEDGPVLADVDDTRGILVREPDSLEDEDDSGIIHMKPAPMDRQMQTSHSHAQHHLAFGGSPISESEPSPDSVSEPDEGDLTPLPEPVIVGARPIPTGAARAPESVKGSSQSSESPSSGPSASGSGGAKLWRMLSGKGQPKEDSGGGGPGGGRKPSFSARVSGMFSSTS